MMDDHKSVQPGKNEIRVDDREQQVLHAALDSFRQYRKSAHFNITHLKRQAFYNLSFAHVDLLSEEPFSLPATFREVDDAIDKNADLAEAILESSLAGFGIDPKDKSWQGAATSEDIYKARSTIRQLYRDWSDEGAVEREACFKPLLDECCQRFVNRSSAERAAYRILVPGAGLGRLVFDLCLAGFTVEGNEISYQQLMASNYILNCTQQAHQHILFPWALGFSNHLERRNQFSTVNIPDVHPATTLAAVPTDVHFSQRMSMSAGDFCVVYRQPENKERFNSVATCYFIDTAPNVINYVDTVRHCLVPGGSWINLGPLVWHFESEPTPAEERAKQGGVAGADDGIGEPGSFELSNDEVLALLDKYGFDVEMRPSPRPCGYIQDPKGMLQGYYQHVFWVATKR